MLIQTSSGPWNPAPASISSPPLLLPIPAIVFLAVGVYLLLLGLVLLTRHCLLVRSLEGQDGTRTRNLVISVSPHLPFSQRVCSFRGTRRAFLSPVSPSLVERRAACPCCLVQILSLVISQAQGCCTDCSSPCRKQTASETQDCCWSCAEACDFPLPSPAHYLDACCPHPSEAVSSVLNTFLTLWSGHGLGLHFFVQHIYY